MQGPLRYGFPKKLQQLLLDVSGKEMLQKAWGRAGEAIRQGKVDGGARLAVLRQWAEEGRLRPFISHVVPLADVKEAFRMMWDRQVTGRICLAPDGEDVATSTAGPPPPVAAPAAATSAIRSRL